MRRLMVHRPDDRHPKARRRAALRHGAVVALSLLLIAVGGRWAVDSAKRGEAGLSVQRVLVEGRERTGRSELIDALEVAIGDPILGIELAPARARLTALSWVRKASLERRLPDTLVLRIVERRPLAIWQHEGAVVVVDVSGEVIDGAEPRDFPDLLLVVGRGAAREAPALLAVMDETPRLRERTEAAVRIADRRWNLRLADGIDVQLPEHDLAGAWRILALLERTEQLLAQDIAAVDLRVPDRLILRLTPAARDRFVHGEGRGEET